MDTNLQIIHEFLQAFAPEVRGLSSDEPPSELNSQITAFVAGDLEQSRQIDFARVVLGSEETMERLAALLDPRAVEPQRAKASL